MGRANTLFIPHAILYLHPEGLTREEFAQELNKIRIGGPTDHHREWSDFGDPKEEAPSFHGGIFELGENLGLNSRRIWRCDYIPFKIRYYELVVIPHKEGEVWQEPRYRVEGRRTRSYPSLAEVVKKHPQYNPDRVFDWTQSSGTFHHNGWCDWKWNRRGDKYFLSETPPKNPPFSAESMYTSIVITAEAIKAQAWNIFGLYGYNHTWRFLVDHPKAYDVYTRAVQNWWLSKQAESRGETNSALLRKRLESPLQSVSLSDQAALSIVIREGVNHRGYISPLPPPMAIPPSPNNEIPF